MSSTYLVGAGFSKAIAPGMPLLNELGERVRIADDVLNARVTDGDVADFERWMSQVATPQPYRDQAANLESQGLYTRAVRAIGSELRGEVSAATEGELPGWVRGLTHLWHAERSTVSTFNYDTLIEISARRSTLWDPEHHLTVPWPTVTNFTPSGLAGRTFGEDGRDVNWESFRLLKLHGSINWYWVSDDLTSATLERVPLFDGGRPDERSFDPARWLPGKVPYIVPPVALKSAFYGGSITSHLWQSASEALRVADEVVLMGYSLPSTDLTTLGLLRESWSGRSDLRLTVCDLDPSPVLDRLLTATQPGTNVTTELFAGPNAIEEFVQQRLPKAQQRALEQMRTVLAAVPADVPVGINAGEGAMRQLVDLRSVGRTATARATNSFHPRSWLPDADLNAPEQIGPSFIVTAGQLLEELARCEQLIIRDAQAESLAWQGALRSIEGRDWFVVSSNISDPNDELT